MANSNRIVPDFTEDLVSFMIQMMLTILSFPRVPFAMIPLSKNEERIFGADVKIDSIAPLYIQFKRSLAYQEFSRAKFLKERKNLNLSNSPIVLYFELRNKDKNHNDFQHNILLDLRNKLQGKGIGDAIYTAPLFLNRSAYLLSMHLNSMLSWRPWLIFRNLPFPVGHFDLITKTGSVKFQNCPVLKDHISIPPHQMVSTHKHRYSYLESGKETCFHSPEIIKSTSNLGQFIYDFINFRDGQPNAELINIEQSMEFLNELNSHFFEQTLGEDEREPILDQWLEFGDRLKRIYNIEQYMLIKFKDN